MATLPEINEIKENLLDNLNMHQDQLKLFSLAEDEQIMLMRKHLLADYPGRLVVPKSVLIEHRYRAVLAKNPDIINNCPADELMSDLSERIPAETIVSGAYYSPDIKSYIISPTALENLLEADYFGDYPNNERII